VCAMSDPDEHSLLGGSGRVLMLGTVMLATAAAAVLAVGAQDPRLLRLGLVAALWAALLGAFAAARMQREIGSESHRAGESQMAYQLELEREVAARWEHTLTVERELRERVDHAERDEIAALRTELAAIRVSLEKLTGGEQMVERVALRAESARLLPAASYSPRFGDSTRAAAASGATAQAAGGITPREDTELRLEPSCQLESGNHFRPLVEPVISGDRTWNPAVLSAPAWEPTPVRNGKHGTSSQEPSRVHNNGSHNNGSHNNGSQGNGGGVRRAAQSESVVGAQRSVNDLLAAHGVDSVPRRRRSREDGPRG
jgi:hypothetical protein